MNSTRKLWIGLAVLLIASFSVLLWIGSEIHRQAPPMPERVVSTDGSVVYNLPQQDMSALRFVMRLGWALPNPVNHVGDAQRFPFAALAPRA